MDCSFLFVMSFFLSPVQHNHTYPRSYHNCRPDDCIGTVCGWRHTLSWWGILLGRIDRFCGFDRLCRGCGLLCPFGGGRFYRFCRSCCCGNCCRFFRSCFCGRFCGSNCFFRPLCIENHIFFYRCTEVKQCCASVINIPTAEYPATFWQYRLFRNGFAIFNIQRCGSCSVSVRVKGNGMHNLFRFQGSKGKRIVYCTVTACYLEADIFTVIFGSYIGNIIIVCGYHCILSILRIVKRFANYI